MATLEAAKVLGMDDRIGSLEPGKQADLIRVRLDDPRLLPIYDIYSALVFAAMAPDVRDVMVAGRWLMRERDGADAGSPEGDRRRAAGGVAIQVPHGRDRPGQSVNAAAPRRVVIDTDPGIDDALAILFALAHPGLDVATITTVGGNVGLDTTTRNALRLLALAGRTLPVYPGAERPLKRGQTDEVRIHGSDGLGGVALPEPVQPASNESAHEALVRLLSEAPPGSLDILALAPLTNIARLVTEAPQAARRIGRLIAMGGAVREPGNVGQRSEFNIAHDPEAAEIVFSAGLPLTLIPLDVTRKVRAGAAWLARLAAAGTAEAMACRDLIGAYFTDRRDAASRPLHDACVPVLALRPELFTVERMQLSVDCSEGDLAGALDPGDHALDVAMGVDAEAVLDLLATVLAQASSPRTTSHQ